MKTSHKIVFGDSRELAIIPNESVHLVVTSPPYWQLKDYGKENQIGFNDTYEQYINNLNLVWSECHRVLHKGCRLCINIGDQFARSVYYGRYKVIPIRTEIIKFCETIGFDYMGAIIWQKVTTCNTTGGATIMGSFPYPRNGILKIDYEFILIFKKYGDVPKVEKRQKQQSILSKEEWNLYFNGHWNFAGEKQNGHLAMFPEELPRRLIKMFSFVGDTVLDPFLGSGTTILAAKNLQRNSIGYEINQDFKEVIINKLKLDKGDIFEKDYEIEFIISSSPNIDFFKKMKSFPYNFKDPVAFDKKIDIKKLSFGSKIDSGTKEKQDYYTVKKILPNNKLLLDNGLSVKLAGIKVNENQLMEFNEFLISKVKGKKVFLKFDKIKYDSDNNLLCYLYLKNKTFINAHLVKYGLALVDDSTAITNVSLNKLKKGYNGKRVAT
ncbi:MAG: DNA methylase N-4 [candidate division Zixibacteria bacterium HGW-Zixibacteria-1]|nr:MAG: DNA methylase N-4 [candidate division Zixibacteria bacterium HGW-Zixibacteria-1]